MDITLPKTVQNILNKICDNGFEAFVVGGCVRDSMLNVKPKDWDITTNALPQQIMHIFSHTIPTGLKHGTVTVIEENESFEITTYRTEGEYLDGRRPSEVIFVSSIAEDLSRRDFTINAMAYNDNLGLIDPFNGYKDLNSKTIKCVGCADKRFKEDALRMLRALRFSCQLDFHIENETLKSIEKNAKLIENVSFERINDEICKMIITDYPEKALELLLQTKLLIYIFPKIDISFVDIILNSLRNSPNSLIVRFSLIFSSHSSVNTKINLDNVAFMMKRLKFDNSTQKKVYTLIENEYLDFDIENEYEIKKFINTIGKELLEEYFQFQLSKAYGINDQNKVKRITQLKIKCSEIVSSGCALTLKELNINGEDIINLGIKPGRELGEMLNFLLESVLKNSEMNKRETLLNIAKEKM